MAQRHLPKKYSEGLPQLADGPSAGLPRVYDIVLEIISHSDGRIDMESVSQFLQAYNNITNLQIGELWAIPIMLRLALIENLRRVSSRIAIDRIHRNLADYWAKEMISTTESDPKNLILVIADMARSNPPLERSFVAEMIRQLRGKGPTLAQALNWMEERLAENGQTSNELVQAENQKQAADQVSVSNSIGSLRLLGSMNWRVFVESISIVEKILREDVIYTKMDFSTRDRYRHVIEGIAKHANIPESDVASIAVGLSQKNTIINGVDDRKSHVGYFLVGQGLPETERLAKMKMPFAEGLRRAFGRFPILMYAGPITLLSLAVTAGVSYKVYFDTHSYALLATIAVLCFISASHFAVMVVNFLATIWVRPSLLPRLDYTDGVPASARTLVAVPTMLISEDEIDHLVEALEVRYLANKCSNLHFGLVTDFKDADQQELPEDHLLINFAQDRINGLNKKYGKEKQDIFYLFHRPRQWNAGEKKWMGYERKRGKLGDLNALLRGHGQNRFSVIIGDQSALQQVKYVLTLDSDTMLPREAAWKIIGTMAHPLNKPYYDEKKQRVTEGYGILQPRVLVSLPGIDSSTYAKMNGNEPGLDPYTRATSDVYQDLFNEGSFIGKGIYDVDIFEKTMQDRFPENRILSHDLLEGCYARSGLISDVQLYEKYPGRYNADMKRRHRWIRGDWQIFAWFLPFVPDAKKHWHINPLSALSRWKIFDNIRRSLVAPALTLWILLGWLVFHDGLYTLLVSSVIVLPGVVVTIWDILRKPKDVILTHHIIRTSRSAGSLAIQTLFMAICLPYEAYVNLDAILRTGWRMLISYRHLLEWNISTYEERMDPKGLPASFMAMWFEPVLAIGVFTYLMYVKAPFMSARPILVLWAFAPVITWWVSRPSAKKSAELSGEQKIFLQKLARKTWSFFEVFVNEREHFLPPDNYQEQPVEVLAHRTSPTNIGMSLLANLSAYDFGYISAGNFLQRNADTLNTLVGMERYHGHFYNWYDTLTAKPMYPRYISTVDSGNMVGHLLTLKQGMFGLQHQAITNPNFFEGLRNTLRVLSDIVDKSDFGLLKQFKADLEAACKTAPKTIYGVKQSLDDLVRSYDAIVNNIKGDENSQAYWWKTALQKQIKDELDQLVLLAPWVLLAEVPKKFTELKDAFAIPTLHQLSEIEDSLKPEIDRLRALSNTPLEAEWLLSFQSAIACAGKNANDRLNAIHAMAEQCDELAEVDWEFLYDKNKSLLTIGYNVEEHRVDPSYYDLLASEARLTSFVAIAQGKLPQESWFALGRLLTNVDDDPILLSWSGSMFEYLMPLLVMPTYPNTLLEQTDQSAVQRQIDYGNEQGVPWGISESCYNTIDAGQNYQYRAFGVPGLGLKRGLGEDLVIAPYATVMALMVNPEKSCQNLQLMIKQGFEGKYGFYESVDYTPSRLQRGQDFAVVNSFMAHHQGMSLLSLAYVLLGQPMQKRFEAEPQFQSTLLLLQERIPRATSYYAHTTDIADTHPAVNEPQVRIITTPYSRVPEVQLLSNGNYHVMLTNSGSGYSRWRNLALTRWREDTTSDNWGLFCYVREVESGNYWSIAHQPTLRKGTNYEVAFSQGRADYKGNHNEIETHTEVVVSPEDDIEMRRVQITNRSGRRKLIEVTSYAEVVLAPMADEAAHPAFSNLFVQTEVLNGQNAILCTRRPKSNDEKMPWIFHLVKMHGKEVRKISYETDRMKFLGRGNSVVNPAAMSSPNALSGSQGPVLDPIVSIRYQISLEEDETIVLDMILGAADTRETCINLVDKYQDKHHKDRVFELAWTHNQVVLRQINATEAEAQLYSRLASSVIFNNPGLRSDPGILIKNRKGQSGLWPYSISGDLPIVLLRVEEDTNIELVRQMVQAHTFWRLKGLIVDLVILNESHGGYRQLLQNQISSLLATQTTDQPGGIFVRNSEQISNEDRILFQTVARVNISGSIGTLADHVNRKPLPKANIPYIVPAQTLQPMPASVLPYRDLQFFNGLGGFSPDGTEYIIHVSNKMRTPAPWVNVIANPNFGTVISESGQSYTWSENAHEFRLSPWNNDPVTDAGGESFYLRDEDTGDFWSPMPLPRGGQAAFNVRHGFGYSVFETINNGISSEVWVYVDLNDAIKFTVIKMNNKSGKPRRISATGYVEWVLGELRPKGAMYITSEVDNDSGAMFARNPYSQEFADRVAFFDVNDGTKTLTADRTEFLGRNGNIQNPDGMSRQRLSGKLGVGIDPCAAIQVTFDLFEGQEKEVIFKLGAGKNTYEAINLVNNYRAASVAHEALNKVRNYWKKTIGALRVETPDAATNLLANGWLTYQTLACRVWGRSGYYQSGGAFGFRDQLQDVMSLIHAEPQIARGQILLSASRQFKEGDAQHWWHPPVGRGVRTRCSDDYLWLPFVTYRYVTVTGDTGILDEQVHFLEGRLLNPDEESYYELSHTSSDTSTLYDHCVRAIKHGLTYGEHGLPLMGTGDWNDGMDRVGRHGKGESVWLGFFLYNVLTQFIEIAELHNDLVFKMQCEAEAKKLRESIEQNAWDGNWYRRAYFDDGTPLGSASNPECQIDSISQSWSVLSGAGSAERTGIALKSADARLVSNEGSLIMLLNPPFNDSALDPGYIKGYVPGVRENGGQYTHAAVWLIMAFAKAGNNKRVWELLKMINPINHGRTSSEISVYKSEPYVIAGDVYAVSPHTGQGGWTWYSGSAGWMYRLITESLLGITVKNNKLSFEPCIPEEWQTFKVIYRWHSTTYNIVVTRDGSAAKTSISMNGQDLPDHEITMEDDGKDHQVEVRLFENTTIQKPLQLDTGTVL